MRGHQIFGIYPLDQPIIDELCVKQIVGESGEAGKWGNKEEEGNLRKSYA